MNNKGFFKTKKVRGVSKIFGKTQDIFLDIYPLLNYKNQWIMLVSINNMMISLLDDKK